MPETNNIQLQISTYFSFSFASYVFVVLLLNQLSDFIHKQPIAFDQMEYVYQHLEERLLPIPFAEIERNHLDVVVD